MVSQSQTRLSRRRLLGASLGIGLGGLLLKGGAKPARAAPQGPSHLMWVWQFSADGEPNFIGAKLRDSGLGMVLKTHDGLQWMSEYDKSPFAVSGPAQISVLANYYESAGVPFHAWAVVHGADPVREARMAADVLAAGARSIFLDVEPSSGFWSGSPADAEAYGQELRRLQPSGQVILSIDPRPWMLARLPMNEFSAFSDAIAPQNYWLTFNTPANYEKFAANGFPTPPEGVTPEFLLAVNGVTLPQLGRPIIHVGQGAATQPDEWRRFINGAYAMGSDYVTVWRYAVTTPGVFDVLREIPPRQPPPLVQASASQVAGEHVVQVGETLGAIAAQYGVSVDDMVQLNGLSDPNVLYVGQTLKVPGNTGVSATAATPVSAQQAVAQSYTIQPGDTLYAIANRFGTSVDAIAQANSLADPNVLAVGQTLVIP